MPNRLVPVGRRQISLSEEGSGDPVLLLHSGGFTSRQWRRLAQALAPTNRVLLPDLLGYGGSTPIPEGEPFGYLEDVDAVLALLANEAPAHVVGHSYGGLLGLLVALREPKAVRSLALYEPVAFGALDQPGDEVFRGDDATLISETFPGEAWLERFVDWWNGPGAFKAMSPEARAGFVAVGWKVFREVNTLLFDKTSSKAYGAITAPTLLLGGGKTPKVEQKVVENLAGALPNARRIVFAEMGHMGPITHASAVNDAIRAHISAS